MPKKAEIILGQDINANIGVRGEEEEDFENVIGPHRFDNRNKKGVRALQWLSLFDLKATNSFSNTRNMLRIPHTFHPAVHKC